MKLPAVDYLFGQARNPRSWFVGMLPFEIDEALVNVGTALKNASASIPDMVVAPSRAKTSAARRPPLPSVREGGSTPPAPSAAKAAG